MKFRMSFPRIPHLAVTLALSLALGLVAQAPPAAHAASFTVTKTTDSADGACNSDCSLREAIIAANASPGADTITLPNGTYVLSIEGVKEDTAATGDLDITGDLTLTHASGALPVIDARHFDRAIEVMSGVNVSIIGITFTNSDTSEYPRGGGITNNGVLTIQNSTLKRNSSEYNGGGAIYNAGALTITSSTIAENTCGECEGGGGILNQGGTLTMNASVVQGNRVGSGDGGGIWSDGTATLTDVTVDGNLSSNWPGSHGGGIWNAGTMKIYDSRIRANVARTGEDEGIVAGGGIANLGTLDIRNTTISQNTALNEYGIPAVGGGLSVSGKATLTNVTIANNKVVTEPDPALSDGGGISVDAGGAITLQNSVVAGNATTSGRTPDCAGTLTSKGDNLIQRTAGCTIAGTTSSNILGIAPELNQDQEGAYEPLPGSPVVDQGSNTGCAHVPQDGNGNGRAICDIGAHELAAIPPPLPSLMANGGMELDANGDGAPDGWTASSSVRRSNASVHSGSYAMRHKSGGNASYTITQLVPNLVPGATYHFNGWVSIPSTRDSFSFRLELRWRNASGSRLSTKLLKSYSAATSGWQLVSADVVAPANTASGELRMVVGSLNAIIDVDDVVLQASNLMANPGFELDANGDSRPDSWSSNSAFTRSSTSKHSGSYAGRHRSTSNSSHAVWQTIPIASGQSAFRFSAWLNVPSTSDSFTFRLLVNWRDTAGTIIQSDELGAATAATGGLVQFTKRLAAPSGTVSATVRQEASSLNATVYVDDLVLQPVSAEYLFDTAASPESAPPDVERETTP